MISESLEKKVNLSLKYKIKITYRLLIKRTLTTLREENFAVFTVFAENHKIIFIEQMIRQGATYCYIFRQINKGYLRYPERFIKFGINLHDFVVGDVFSTLGNNYPPLWSSRNNLFLAVGIFLLGSHLHYRLYYS